MELGAHHVVVVSREDGDAVAGLPVPYPDGLIVGRREDPGILVVEHGGSDVVEVSHQVEEAPLELVVPHLDLVVVAARDEERLLLVEVDPAHGPVVLVELLQEGAHPVVPQLDDAGVKAETVVECGHQAVKAREEEPSDDKTDLASIHGLLGWNASPLTLGDLVSNLVSMMARAG